MFDASFPEIILILLVALIVIGPERLPKLARTMGYWVGRGRAVFNSMRDEVEREIQMDELRKAESDLKKDLDLSQDLMRDVEQSGSYGGIKGNRAGKSGSSRAGGAHSKSDSVAGRADVSNGGPSSEDDGPKAGS